MIGPFPLRITTDLPPRVTDPGELAAYLRRHGLSCLSVTAPGALTNWGVINLATPTDLDHTAALLDGHAQITAAVESVNRTDEGWAFWYRLTRPAPVYP